MLLEQHVDRAPSATASTRGSRRWASITAANFERNPIRGFVTLAELASELGAGRATVRAWLAEDGVPAFVFGGGPNASVRYKRCDVTQWIEENAEDEELENPDDGDDDEAADDDGEEDGADDDDDDDQEDENLDDEELVA